MTSEEIIQRLLDDKKITTKEALIILKDITKVGLKEILNPNKSIEDEIPYNIPVVVMYGVTTNSYEYKPNDNWTQSSTISNTKDE